MENETIKFKFNEQEVRIDTDENQETWFVGIDVCNILGYAKADKTITDKLDEDERELGYVTGTSGQRRKAWKINEFGLYSLILSSQKPEAKVFKRWVTHEVLPAIRKAGRYTTEAAQQKELDLQRLSLEIEKIENDINLYKSQIKSWNTDREQKLSELKQIIKSDPNQLRLFNKEQ